MALLDVCGISDWVKEDTFSSQKASVDRVNHFNFAALEPELAVPIGVDVSGIFHYRYHEALVETFVSVTLFFV